MPRTNAIFYRKLSSINVRDLRIMYAKMSFVKDPNAQHPTEYGPTAWGMAEAGGLRHGDRRLYVRRRKVFLCGLHASSLH
jgi:hypothetical protein